MLMTMVVVIVAVLAMGALISSEIVWARRVKAAFQHQREAYQGIADAYKRGDVAALLAAEDRAMEAAREFRALRRWYPWRRL